MTCHYAHLQDNKLWNLYSPANCRVIKMLHHSQLHGCSTVHYVLTSSFLLNLSNFLLTQQQRRFVSHFSVFLANAFNQSQTTNKDFLIFDGESFLLFPFSFRVSIALQSNKQYTHTQHNPVPKCFQCYGNDWNYTSFVTFAASFFYSFSLNLARV